MRLLRVLLVTAVCASAVWAQDGERPARTESDPPLPTLDELLGTGDEPSDAGEAPELPGEEAESDLDRLLSGREIADEFRAAVDLMDRSALRLGSARDTSTRTQRMQEDVLRKLDKLIADAEQRAQQQGGSPSSSSSQNQPQPGQSQPGQQSQPQPAGGDNQREMVPPGLRTGPLRPEEVSDLAAWGSLPARVRDALVQGSTDQFSATYRKLTEAYYRMLAEEPKQ